MTPDRVDRLLEEHVGKGEPDRGVAGLDQRRQGPEKAFLDRQQRIVLRNCGLIDPETIEDYLEVGGYQALQKVLDGRTPTALINADHRVRAARPRRRGLPHRA